MSSFCKCKSYSHFFSKTISLYVIFNDQRFNDTLPYDIVSFEQLGLVCYVSTKPNEPADDKTYNKTFMTSKTQMPVYPPIIAILLVNSSSEAVKVHAISRYSDQTAQI